MDLAAEQLAAGDRSLVYTYYAEVDGKGHRFGVDSDAWRGQLMYVDRLVQRLAEQLPPRSALYVTADHGMIDIPFDERVPHRLRRGLGAARRRRPAGRRGPGPPCVRGAGRRSPMCSPSGARCSASSSGWRAATRRSRRAGSGRGSTSGCTPGSAMSSRPPATTSLIIASEREPKESAMVGMHGSMTPVEQLVPLLEVRSVDRPSSASPRPATTRKVLNSPCPSWCSSPERWTAESRTLALQIEHNRSARGLQGMIFTRDDRAGEGKLSSRLGLVTDAVEAAEGMDFYAHLVDHLSAGRPCGLRHRRRGAVPRPGADRPARPRRRRPRPGRLRLRHHHRLPHQALPRLAAADRTGRPGRGAPGRGAVLVRRPRHAQRPHGRRRDGRRGRPGRRRRRRTEPTDEVGYEVLCRRHHRRRMTARHRPRGRAVPGRPAGRRARQPAVTTGPLPSLRRAALTARTSPVARRSIS